MTQNSVRYLHGCLSHRDIEQDWCRPARPPLDGMTQFPFWYILRLLIPSDASPMFSTPVRQALSWWYGHWSTHRLSGVMFGVRVRLANSGRLDRRRTQSESDDVSRAPVTRGTQRAISTKERSDIAERTCLEIGAHAVKKADRIITTRIRGRPSYQGTCCSLDSFRRHQDVAILWWFVLTNPGFRPSSVWRVLTCWRAVVRISDRIRVLDERPWAIHFLTSLTLTFQFSSEHFWKRTLRVNGISEVDAISLSFIGRRYAWNWEMCAIRQLEVTIVQLSNLNQTRIWLETDRQFNAPESIRFLGALFTNIK
jgi:hypothetical protein